MVFPVRCLTYTTRSVKLVRPSELALRFFRQEGGMGTKEVILPETKEDESSGQPVPVANVVLKLDFETWSWKRVRKKVKQ